MSSDEQKPAKPGMDMGVKIMIWVFAGLVLLGLLVVGAGFAVWKWKGKEWAEKLGEQGKIIKAEAEAYGAKHSKDDCLAMAIEKLGDSSGITGGVMVKVYLETCLGAAKGELKYCADVPEKGEIIKTVAWRMRMTTALGLEDADNPIVKAIQDHCRPD